MNKKNLIIVFTRNPELGKVKTRLAKTVGASSALDIYTFLLEHTEIIIRNITSDKAVYYSEKIREGDLWDNNIYLKYLQEGDDLGEKMHNAFKNAFNKDYEKVVIVGSDLFDLKESHLLEAFQKLNTRDVVIGPAKDGGYYLLGMKQLHPILFKNKKWGAATVLESTLNDLQQEKVKLLEALNDIDTFEDLQQQPELLKRI